MSEQITLRTLFNDFFEGEGISFESKKIPSLLFFCQYIVAQRLVSDFERFIIANGFIKFRLTDKRPSGENLLAFLNENLVNKYLS